MNELVTVETIFDILSQGFRPEKASNETAVIQYYIKGSGGGNWIMSINKGKCDVKKGEHPAAHLSVFVELDDFIDIGLGRLDSIKAYMTQKLRVKGDINVAMKMDTWFDRPSTDSARLRQI